MIATPIAVSATVSTAIAALMAAISAPIVAATGAVTVSLCFMHVETLQQVFYEVLMHIPWGITVCPKIISHGTIGVWLTQGSLIMPCQLPNLQESDLVLNSVLTIISSNSVPGR